MQSGISGLPDIALRHSAFTSDEHSIGNLLIKYHHDTANGYSRVSRNGRGRKIENQHYLSLKRAFDPHQHLGAAVINGLALAEHAVRRGPRRHFLVPTRTNKRREWMCSPIGTEHNTDQRKIRVKIARWVMRVYGIAQNR
ncbi:hypothetical protein [Burkholderia cenocepacia]|uniref:hypothetical protein n=1 Tax=Burkholderia cenocepacia TaxID=95486 RepID=UPI0018A7F7EA|nr:hypothetical protein [Burkholderia cenocepacia]